MKYLVIGPGAMGIFALLGHLKNIEHKLKDVQEISGASAGSILALMFALGKSIDDMLDIALRLNISDLVKLNLKCFIHKFGLVDTEPMKKKLIEICGCNPTFKELDKKIYVSTFCVNTSTTEYFSVDTHPDMHVIDAVCMSIAIPFVFSSIKYNEKTYVDGGTVESMPLAPFLDKPAHQIHCIRIHSRTKYVQNIDNPRLFAQSLIMANLNNRYNYPLTHQTIKDIDVGDMDIFDFNMSYEDKIKMYLLGTS